MADWFTENAPGTATAGPPAGTDIRSLIDQAADRHGVDRQLGQTVARIESNYNPDAVSPAGAQGVMQLMPATARSYGVKDSFDPAQNIDAGMRMLSDLSRRYGGDRRLILAAYNAGPGAVDKYGGVPPYRQTQNYVAKGMRNMGTASRSAPEVETPAAPAAAETPAQGDILSRLAAGEDIEITPQTIAQIIRGPKKAEAPPAAPPAVSAGPVQAGDWFARNAPAPPPEKPPLTPSEEAQRLGSIVESSSGVKAAKDVLGGGAAALTAFLTGGWDEENAARLKSGISTIAGGIAQEPERMRQELVKSGEAMTKGDINEAADHLWFSLPFAGAAGAVMKQYLEKGDVRGAFAHAVGALIPAAAPIAVKDPGAIAEAVTDAAQATREAATTTAKVAVPVVREMAKAAATRPPVGATLMGEMIGGHQGAAAAAVLAKTPAVLGAGIRAARGALAERAAAAEAAAAEETAAAAPAAATKAPTVPVTGATDDALINLYSVESDPVKKAALRTELVNRGLVSKTQPEGAATVAPEANPYRTYTQDALRRAYQVETDAAKRTLMEQAASDRNLSLMSREARRATAAPPETGFAEQPGPSLTQDEALVLRYLGEDDPNTARVEDIATARKLIADDPQLLTRLRKAKPAEPPAGSTVPQPEPAQPAAAQTPAQPAPATTAAVPTLDEIALGQPNGKPFNKLSAADQQNIRNIQALMQRNAAGTTEAPAPPYVRPPAPAEPPAAPGKTAAEMLQEEIAAKRAAEAPVTPGEAEQAFRRQTRSGSASIVSRLKPGDVVTWFDRDLSTTRTGTFKGVAPNGNAQFTNVSTKAYPGEPTEFEFDPKTTPISTIDRPVTVMRGQETPPTPPAAAPQQQPPAAEPAAPPATRAQKLEGLVENLREQGITGDTLPWAMDLKKFGAMAKNAGLDEDISVTVRDVLERLRQPETPRPVTPSEGEQAFAEAKSEQPQTEEPGRTKYSATGERKSPQLRGAEIKLKNIEDKAQRWVEAFRKYGMKPSEVLELQPGWVSAEAIAQGAAPGWENVMHDLIGRGLLEKGERRPPVESLPRIVELMRAKK